MEFGVAPAAHLGGTVLAVRGELDIATSPVFGSAVEAALARRPSTLVIDLTATTFVDSSACRALVLAAREGSRAHCPVEVVCPRDNGPVRRVLDLVGLEAVTPVRERLDDTPLGPPAGDVVAGDP